MNTNFSPILFVLAIRVQFGRLPGYIHCSYKLVLLENSLKLNCLFCRKEYPFQEPKAIFLFIIHHMIYRHTSNRVHQM